LERRGQLDKTVIVVTGDRGEAFGDLYRQNLAHKNFVYDENVRSFFMLSDPAWNLDSPVVSDRVASNVEVHRRASLWPRGAL